MRYGSKARKKIVEEFINCLSEDEIPWEMPWHSFYNPITEHQYTGGFNSMVLNYYAYKNNYKDPRWMTYHQAQEKGWKVKQGEHGAKIEFWSPYNKLTKQKMSLLEVKKLLEEDINAKDYICYISSSYTVFNAEQITGVPELPLKPSVEKTDILARVEVLAKGMGVKQSEEWRAAYSPSDDRIILPSLQSFKNEKAYCATFLHELAHATGHESRLNRNIKNEFGSFEYAKEELRAEIASAFMMGILDVDYDNSHMESHKAYVASWIDILKNDPEELFKAIKDADQIQAYMMELCPEQIKDVSKEDKQYSLDERIAVAKQKVNSSVNQDSKVCEKEVLQEVIA